MRAVDTNVLVRLIANEAFVKEMRSRGTSFSLRENEEQAITAAEVSVDEINRIALRLGIY